MSCLIFCAYVFLNILIPAAVLSYTSSRVLTGIALAVEAVIFLFLCTLAARGSETQEEKDPNALRPVPDYFRKQGNVYIEYWDHKERTYNAESGRFVTRTKQESGTLYEFIREDSPTQFVLRDEYGKTHTARPSKYSEKGELMLQNGTPLYHKSHVFESERKRLWG